MAIRPMQGQQQQLSSQGLLFDPPQQGFDVGQFACQAGEPLLPSSGLRCDWPADLNRPVPQDRCYQPEPNMAPQCIVSAPDQWPRDGQTNNGAVRLSSSATEKYYGSEREYILVRRVQKSAWEPGITTVEYECRICGRKCRWRSSISVHIRTHTGRKPYPCRVCRHTFADSSTRKKHEKKTHYCVFSSKGKAADRAMPQSSSTACTLPQLKCHLCFVPLESEAHLTSHLQEFHNQMIPQFRAAFAAPPDPAESFGTTGKVESDSFSAVNLTASQGTYLKSTWSDQSCSWNEWPHQPIPPADARQYDEAADLPAQRPVQQSGIPLPVDVAKFDTARDDNFAKATLLFQHSSGIDYYRQDSKPVAAAVDGNDSAAQLLDSLCQPEDYAMLDAYDDVGDLCSVESTFDDGGYSLNAEFDGFEW